MAESSLIPHIPVLYKEVIEHAQVREGELWVDCTLGRGGHCEGLLRAGARVIGLDKDPSALLYCQHRLVSYQERFEAVRADFRSIADVLHERGIGAVDGILADLGVSSPQLDQAERGFSFLASGPVDMRMDPERGLPAEQWIEQLSEAELITILRRYGEEPLAKPFARVMKRWSEQGGGDTLSLARSIEDATPAKIRYRNPKKHPATRVFQALRIFVNDELGALEELLNRAPHCLKPGGRLLLISFHSLEDRALKQRFKVLSEPAKPPRRGLPLPPDTPPPQFDMHPRKPIAPSDQELHDNPRARSAKLRVLRRRSITSLDR